MDLAPGRIVESLQRHGLDAVICRLPQNVLLLSGYFPVLGNSFCVASISGRDLDLRLVIPEDDLDLVPPPLASAAVTYTEETLEMISTTVPAVTEPLGRVLEVAGLSQATVGYEGWPAPAVAAYTQVGVPGPETLQMYQRLLPTARLADASEALLEAAAVKTEAEIARIREAADVARHGFIAARQRATPGHTEADVAAAFMAAVYPAGHGMDGVSRLIPHVHVMAGPRAALAYRAYNLTSNYVIQPEDTVLVQTEICVNGYWAEMTRTFFAGGVSELWANAHRACLRAQDAALSVVSDGAIGSRVDDAARSVMRQAGLGEAFKHGLGHGVGFQAINHAAIPKLHPVSDTVLGAGMVSNIEPAVYLDDRGGLRLNDDMLVLPDRGELLTGAIPRELDWLVTG